MKKDSLHFKQLHFLIVLIYYNLLSIIVLPYLLVNNKNCCKSIPFPEFQNKSIKFNLYISIIIPGNLTLVIYKNENFNVKKAIILISNNLIN